MRWPRLRLRTLMLLMAAATLMLWGATLGWRSYGCYLRARELATHAEGWHQIAARGGSLAHFADECASYYAPLAAKYRRAMWRPWLPIEPDPHAPGYDAWVEQERRASGGARPGPGAAATDRGLSP